MICVMSFRNILIGQTRSVCEVRCRRILRRDTPYGEAKFVCFSVVSCAMWVLCCVRTSLEGQTSCVFVFFSSDSTPTIFSGVRTPCVFHEVRCAHRTCVSASASVAQVVQRVSVNICSSCVSSSFCNILGSANDMLPLMVLGSVGCNTMEENNTYRPLCKVLWVG